MNDKITILDGFEYKATIIQTSGVTETGNCRIYWQGDPKEIDMKQYIPIEWIRKYTNHRTVEFGDMWVFINCMINDWEQENEKGNVG